MSRESRRIAGVLLVLLPTVMIGGVSLLSLLVWEPALCREPATPSPVACRARACGHAAGAEPRASSVR
jgi:hypothetical protein